MVQATEETKIPTIPQVQSAVAWWATQSETTKATLRRNGCNTIVNIAKHYVKNIENVVAVKAEKGFVKSQYDFRHVKALRWQALLEKFCGAKPGLLLVEEWINRKSEELQNWVGEQKGTPQWLQNIGVLDGIDAMSICPTEGDTHPSDPAYAYLKLFGAHVAKNN